MPMMWFLCCKILRALGPVLELFGAASGYKINELKSAIMGMNIPSERRDQITVFTLAPWEESVTYLGIRLVGCIDAQTLINLNI